MIPSVVALVGLSLEETRVTHDVREGHFRFAQKNLTPAYCLSFFNTK